MISAVLSYQLILWFLSIFEYIDSHLIMFLVTYIFPLSRKNDVIYKKPAGITKQVKYSILRLKTQQSHVPLNHGISPQNCKEYSQRKVWSHRQNPVGAKCLHPDNMND